MFSPGCWLLMSALVFFMAAPSGMAALTVITGNKLVWDFTLSRSAGGSDTLDQLAVSFGEDKLSDSEHLLLTLAASGQVTPVYFHDWAGSASGTGNILMILNLDNAFPDLTGSLTLELLNGSVDVVRTTLIIVSPAVRETASATHNVTLVPEPQSTVMVAAALLPLLVRRKRGGAVAG